MSIHSNRAFVTPPQATLDPQKLPRHIAIIMDGNRRWAKQLGWLAIRGHSRGARATHDIIDACVDLRIGALTLYTFSTENWKRPSVEVAALLRVISHNLKQELPDMVAKNIQVRHVGRRAGLPDHLIAQLDACAAATRENTGLILNLAINYGGRAEIADAFRELMHKVQEGTLRADEVDEAHIAGALYMRDLPDPDLMIRTGGELRTSNFLPWQLAYTELWVTPTLWPDFTPSALHRAIADFQCRDRRFGGAKE